MIRPLAALAAAALGTSALAQTPNPDLNRPGTRAVVVWDGRIAEIAFHGPGKPATGVLNGKTAFQLDTSRTDAIANEFAAAGVAGMPERIGGIPGRSGAMKPGDPPPLVGWVTVIDADGKRIANANQLGGGTQSTALADFAKVVVGRCEASATDGVRPTDFADAAKRVHAGDASPLVLRIDAISTPEPGSGGKGYHFRLQDGVVTTCMLKNDRFDSTVRWTVPAKDLEYLTKLLADPKFARAKSSFWHHTPTELTISLLGHERKFATQDRDAEAGRAIRMRFARQAMLRQAAEEETASDDNFSDVLHAIYTLHRETLKANGLSEDE